MIRFWLVGALAIGVVAGVVLARNGIVRTTDGQTYEGEVREEDDSVIVVIRGIETVLRRENVESIEYPESAEKQFEQRMAKLEDGDVRGRLELAQWAFKQREYDLALQALESALQIDPNSREAVDMQTQVRSQIRLERQQRRQAEQRAAARDGAAREPAQDQAPAAQGEPLPQDEPAPRGQLQRDRRLLSNDDINRIRQKELQRSDTRVRIRFDNNVIRRYAEESKQNFQAFSSLPQVQQALEIIEYKEDPQGRFARDVRILDDPSALREYKTQIQPAVLANCATSNCHGAAGAGNFVLYTPADNDAVSYTNFYVLQNYVRDPPSDGGGVFGGGELRMIDRNRGENSLLVQYGLPRDVAQHAHSNVRNMRPMLRNRDDPQYRRIVNWMNTSLRPVAPEYGIQFDPRSAPAPDQAPDTPQPQEAPPPDPAPEAPAQKQD